jgi:alkylation response protein AidB-like acyl-CoA dehydrogenase
MSRLTAEVLIDDLTAEERARAERVEAILPVLARRAEKMDHDGFLDPENVKTLSEAGLLGLVVPTDYGGLGGGLRDWAAAAFAMGTVCPSTALTYFFHNTSASRGTLALAALEAGKFSKEEAPVVRAFSEKLLTMMGREGKWMANFASEDVKSEKAAITIQTTARKVDGGWELNGSKSFGCATGIADVYLVTASLEGIHDASGLATFIVRRGAKGERPRAKWDSLGMRGTATEGLVLENVFVADDDALAIRGAFTRSCEMSRTSFVGNQVAASVIYLGGAYAAYHAAMKAVTTRKFEDTGKVIGTGPYQQQLIGQMYADLHTALLWATRQVNLESNPNPPIPKPEINLFWRTCKGQISEYSFKVAQSALKMLGTSGTSFSAPASRAIRDLAMGLVQAFPAERGRLQTAQYLVEGAEQLGFGAAPKDRN